MYVYQVFAPSVIQLAKITLQYHNEINNIGSSTLLYPGLSTPFFFT